MNRAIKFRQPIFLNGKFHNWHYWGFVHRGEFTGPIGHAEKALEDSRQFIDRFDKNGKEVYRGDVVVFKYNPGNNNPIFKGREYNALVEWDSCNPCFVLVEIGPAKRREYDFVMAGLLTLEVIGNEWENPELLK